MKKHKAIVSLIVGLFVLTFVFPVLAADLTPQRVVDHVDKAVQLILDKGEAEAYPLLTDPKGEWVDGDLYVFIYNFNGDIVAHLNQKLVGKNLMKVKDVKGNVFAAEFVAYRQKRTKAKAGANTGGPNPAPRRLHPKPVLSNVFRARIPSLAWACTIFPWMKPKRRLDDRFLGQQIH